MYWSKPFTFFLLFLLSIGSCTQKTTQIWLDDLNIKSFSQGIPSISSKKCASGDTIRLGGKKYERGVGVQSLSILSMSLNGNARHFSAVVGADDMANKEVHYSFFVLGDRKILFESGEMKVGDQPKNVEVDLKGIKRLGLLVTIKGEEKGKTYSDWADARIEMMENTLPEQIANSDEKYILTPKPSPAR